MASRYYTLNVLTPAGTTVAAPLSTTWLLEDQILTGLEIDIPDGHNANTGIRMLRSTQQVIPWGNKNYLIANDRLLTIAVGDELTEGKLVVVTYNVDIYDHTFYLRATITDVATSSSGGASGAPAVATALLTSSGVPSL